jgi:hypothetical protein
MLQVKIYKGYTITLDNEGYGLFNADNGENSMSDYSLPKLQERIDATIKRKEKADAKRNFPIEAIYKAYGFSIPIMGKITSVAENGDVWFSFADSDGKLKREKVGAVGFYKPTEANILIMKEYKNNSQLVQDIANTNNTLANRLADAYTLTELTGE